MASVNICVRCCGTLKNHQIWQKMKIDFHFYIAANDRRFLLQAEKQNPEIHPHFFRYRLQIIEQKEKNDLLFKTFFFKFTKKNLFMHYSFFSILGSCQNGQRLQYWTGRLFLFQWCRTMLESWKKIGSRHGGN